MEDPKNRKELEAKWWDTWWQLDYSWDGQADKKHAIHFVSQLTSGSRYLSGQGFVPDDRPSLSGSASRMDKTLQDYWRWDPTTGVLRDDQTLKAGGELEECDGVIFHIAHLPPKKKSGQPTWKANLKDEKWTQLEALISARIAAAGETEFIDLDGRRYAKDNRAQLQGTVLRHAVPHPRGEESTLHLNCQRMVYLGGDENESGGFIKREVDYSLCTFGHEVSFFGALFLHRANFAGASFSGNAIFNGAIFSGIAAFGFARFSGETRFQGAVFFEIGYFSQAIFSGGTNFESASFFAGGLFDACLFTSLVTFEKAAFYGRMVAATWGLVKYQDERVISFSPHKRSYANDQRNPDRFYNRGCASFWRAIFKEEAWCMSARFLGDCHFDETTFAHDVGFWNARFVGKMNFSSTTFEKIASFENITWPKTARDWHGAFKRTRFLGSARFQTATGDAGFQTIAAFNGVALEDDVVLDWPSEVVADREFENQRTATQMAAQTDVEEWAKDEIGRRKRARSGNESAASVTNLEKRKREHYYHDVRLRELEGGCRALRQAMEKASDKSRERIFHRYELISHASQRSVPRWEKVISSFYRWSSNYGDSIGRPLIWLLLCLLPAFGVAHGLWGLSSGAGCWTLLRHGVIISAARLFPIGPWNIEKNVLHQFLSTNSPGLFPLVATAESILGAIFIFLFALAIRRRFLMR